MKEYKEYLKIDELLGQQHRTFRVTFADGRVLMVGMASDHPRLLSIIFDTIIQTLKSKGY